MRGADRRENATHSAARSDPIGQSQARQSDGHRHHHQQLDRRGLLPQTRQVFIPDTQQLLLAVGVSHKLRAATVREQGQRQEQGGSVRLLLILKVVLQLLV